MAAARTYHHNFQHDGSLALAYDLHVRQEKMNPTYLAHQVVIVEPFNWGGFIWSSATVLAMGILGLVWYHTSPPSTKRSSRFYFFLLFSCIALMTTLFGLVYRTIHGVTLEETFQEISELKAEELENLLDTMGYLSRESLVLREEKIISGRDEKLIPETLNRISPHSIHLNKGDVHVLLNKQNEKSLLLAVRQRGDDYYMLLNFRDERSRTNLYRELYPTSRIEELVEQVSSYNSGQSLRD